METSVTAKEIVSGVICEFNPLHLGHRLLLAEAKKAGPVVCAMSGNFVQRGEPAILDKWTRTRMALNNGADLVVELPLPFATAGAQTFAKGGTALLAACGVTRLCFGSESGSLKDLQAIAAILKSDSYALAVREAAAKGISFASAREAAVHKLLGPAYSGELAGPNNNLALEYLLAMPAGMSAHTLLRQGGSHDEAYDGALCSAMHIRAQLKTAQDPSRHLPRESAALLAAEIEAGRCPASFAYLERAVLAKLRTLPQEAFSALPDISEGIENKLYKAVRGACSLEALYSLTKSKRYSHARIRRLVLHAFLGITPQVQRLLYIRVLGMNAAGEQLLRAAAKKGLPIIGKAADLKKLSPDALAQFKIEAQGGDLYALAAPAIQPCGMDYTHKMVRV